MHFHGNNGHVNASQCYIIHTLPILLRTRSMQVSFMFKRHSILPVSFFELFRILLMTTQIFFVDVILLYLNPTDPCSLASPRSITIHHFRTQYYAMLVITTTSQVHHLVVIDCRKSEKYEFVVSFNSIIFIPRFMKIKGKRMRLK